MVTIIHNESFQLDINRKKNDQRNKRKSNFTALRAWDKQWTLQVRNASDLFKGQQKPLKLNGYQRILFMTIIHEINNYRSAQLTLSSTGTTSTTTTTTWNRRCKYITRQVQYQNEGGPSFLVASSTPVDAKDLLLGENESPKFSAKERKDAGP